MDCFKLGVNEIRLIDADAIPYVESQDIYLYDYAFRYDINEMPTVDAVEVRHGRWIPKQDGFWQKQILICSICGSRNALGYEFNYCPNCGAKMDGDDDGQL